MKKLLSVGVFLIFPVLFFCTTVDFSEIDSLVSGPIILIDGKNPDTINVGETWTEPPVTASDATDGDLTDSIVKTGSVDVNKAGTYEITYSVKNSENVVTSAILTVIVEDNGSGDTEKPVITIPGQNPVTITEGDSWSEPNVTANDNVDGDITSKLTKTGSVNTNEPNTYTITWSVTDNAGNTASATLTVIVQEKGTTDTEKPVITISGPNPATINIGETWTDPQVTANDNIDGDLTNALVKTGSVDNTKAGTNTLTWSVSDAAGNSASATLTVIVKDTITVDTEKPVITISGTNPVTIKVGDSWSNPAATATDNVDGVIPSSSITISGTVDTSKAGTYEITYSVSDAAGNTATEVLTVIVQDNSVTDIFEDFDYGDKGQHTFAEKGSFAGGYWYGYTDASEGGNSTIVPDPEAGDTAFDAIVTDQNGSTGNSLHATLTLNKGIQYSYAAVGVLLNEESKYYDLSGMTAIKLKLKGTGKIRLVFETKKVLEWPVADEAWGHLGKDITLPGDTWTEVTINISELVPEADSPQLTAGVKWGDADVSNQVKSLLFAVSGENADGVVTDLYIDDIDLIGVTSDNLK